MKVESFPIFQIVTPGGPEFRRVAGDFVPVMTHEKEAVRALLNPGKVLVMASRRGNESEDVAKDFWGHAGNIQQGVSGTLDSSDLCV